MNSNSDIADDETADNLWTEEEQFSRHPNYSTSNIWTVTYINHIALADELP